MVVIGGCGGGMKLACSMLFDFNDNKIVKPFVLPGWVKVLPYSSEGANFTVQIAFPTNKLLSSMFFLFLIKQTIEDLLIGLYNIELPLSIHLFSIRCNRPCKT